MLCYDCVKANVCIIYDDVMKFNNSIAIIEVTKCKCYLKDEVIDKVKQ